MESGGASQRAAAMAAFQNKAKTEAEPEFKPHSQLSAREKAMQNLNRKGVVSAREARGATGASQHGAALAGLQAAGIQDEPVKVVPNWKRTDAQKKAAAAAAEIRGSTNHAAAMAKFGTEVKKQMNTAPASFVPVAKTAGGATKFGTPRTGQPAPAPAAVPVSRPHAASSAGAGSNTAEAAEGVEKDLALLIAAFPRLGTPNADGSIETTFGKIVDDDQLEQQLESLVGTLKAGRKRGLLEWEGQMLLKGPHDGVAVKYVGDTQPAAAQPEPTPPPVPKPEPVPPEPAAPEPVPLEAAAAEAVVEPAAEPTPEMDGQPAAEATAELVGGESPTEGGTEGSEGLAAAADEGAAAAVEVS